MSDQPPVSDDAGPPPTTPNSPPTPGYVPPQAGYPPPQGGYVPPLQPGMPGPLYLEPPTSGMAIASLVVGIASFAVFPFIGHIVAVVLGYIARNEIRTSGGRVGGNGMATTGIILGFIGIGLSLVGIVLIIVLIGIAVANVHNITFPTPLPVDTPTPNI